MARVLVIEDEPDLGSLLEYNLKAEGHVPQLVRTGAAAMARLDSFKPDLVLLDLMLPDVSGADVARMIRGSADHRDVPLIMVTARGEEADRIKGLEVGADDYVVKPFVVKELMLRVTAVLRRAAGAVPVSARTLQAANVALDTERHEVRVGGQLVTLTALEFRLLRTLLERPGRVQTRDTLLSDVWGIDAEITTRTVDTHIKRLREKLGPAADIIETLRGVGYRLGLS
ncbi:MAG: response regulator transcription factor [Myxococcaceae bacterium]|nr:response regulator transcription factor [Myxococcaceae bacterium]